MKIKRILVPIDFSELSEKVMKVAQNYAELFEAKISLLHAYHSEPLLGEYDGLGMSFDLAISHDLIQKSLKDRLDDLADKYFTPSTFETTLLELGVPANVICECTHEFDMVVMGTHGRKGIERFFLGSVAEKVIRCSKVPVMLVEQYSEVFPIKKIMVTTDFSENSFTAFPLVAEIAKRSNAEVSLVNIRSTDNIGNLEEMNDDVELRKKWMEKIDDMFFSKVKGQIKHEVFVSGKSVPQAIFEQNYARKYNLIVMATLGKSAIKQLVVGSTAASVVRNVETAVIVVNPHSK